MAELADAGIPVTVTCRVLMLARQPCYRWLADPITKTDKTEVVEAYRVNALFDGASGGPRVRAAAARRRGPRRR